MTQSFLFILLVSAITVAEPLPSYYEDQLAEKLPIISQNRKGQRDGFVYWTDSHVKSNSKHAPELINGMLEGDRSPKVFFGGDCMPATGKSIEESLNIQRELVGRINGKTAFFCLRGNHDFYYRDADNRKEGQTLSQENTATILADMTRGKAVKNKDDAGVCYFYYDNPKAKIRYVAFTNRFWHIAVQNSLPCTRSGCFEVSAVQKRLICTWEHRFEVSAVQKCLICSRNYLL